MVKLFFCFFNALIQYTCYREQIFESFTLLFSSCFKILIIPFYALN